MGSIGAREEKQESGDVDMIRMQVRLTDEQVSALKALAAEEGVSTAALIRRSVTYFVHHRTWRRTEQSRQNALAMVGKYTSNRTDVSQAHDQYLAGSYGTAGE